MVALADSMAQMKMFSGKYVTITNEPVPTAQLMEELLLTQGWCLLTCRALDGEMLVIVNNDNLPELPAYANFPIYTINEIYLVARMNNSTFKLVHLAKKLAGAVIESVIKVKHE